MGTKQITAYYNLQIMNFSSHSRLHNKGNNHYLYGKHHLDETKQKISESCKNKIVSEETKKKISIAVSQTSNTTGFYRVSKHKQKECKQGFFWEYSYHDSTGKIIRISSIDLNKLKQKVLERGLEWYEIENKSTKNHFKTECRERGVI